MKVVSVIKDTKQIDIDMLYPFQGATKELSQKNRYKLRKEILDTGFSFAFHVWKLDERYYIIDGHQRLSVLKNLRREGYEIPLMTCNLIDAANTKEAKERVLQAISQYGKLNKSGLEDFVGDDFDNLTMDERFDFPDFSFDFDKEAQDEKDKKDSEDDVPEVDGNTRGIAYGDVYQLGSHYLSCGDSTNEQLLGEFLAGQRFDCVFFDPPYTKASEKLVEPDWFKKTFEYIDDGNLIICSSPRVLRECYPVAVENGLDLRYDIIWHRGTPLLGPMLEKPLMFHVPFDIYRKGKHFFNRHNEGVKEYLDDIDRIPSVIKCTRERDVGRGGKPMKLMAPLLGTFSNDKVLDLCGGNGSTMIASEIVGRQCYMVELDPIFCNVIIDRWEKHTGKVADKVGG